MKKVFNLLILYMIVVFSYAQGIKVDAGQDLNLSCFDEIQINGRIINWSTKYASEKPLKSVYFVDDSVGYAIGTEIIIKTTDGGDTWEQLTCPYNRRLNDVYFINRDTGFIVGGLDFWEGALYKTTDGGNTWVKNESFVDDELNTITFINDTVGFTAGWLFSVLKTIDAGETWYQVPLTGYDYNDIFFKDNFFGLTVGVNGQICKTENGGEEWEQIEIDFVFDLNSIIITEEGAYAAGNHGIVLFSTDVFETFTILNTGTLADLYDISFINKDSITVVGRKNTILKSFDGGLSWSEEYADNKEGNIYKSITLNNGAQIAVGYIFDPYHPPGCFLKCQEIPSPVNISWSPPDFLSDPKSLTPTIVPQQSTSYTLNLSYSSEVIATDVIDVSVYTPGIYAGQDSTINKYDTIQLHSVVENGNWELKTNISLIEFKAVEFINNDTGFIIGKNKILKTIDGGISWEHKIFAMYGSFWNLHFPSDSVGYVVGGNGIILKTTDFGETWNSLVSGTEEHLLSVQFLSDSTGFVSGRHGKILKTTDGGISWVELNSGSPWDIYKIYFINENRGFITTTEPFEYTYRETFDGGNTWHGVYIPEFYNVFVDIFFVNERTGFMVGSMLGAFVVNRTTDGGASWKTDRYFRPSATTYWSVFFIDEYTGYVGSDIGEIFKTFDGGNTWFIPDTLLMPIRDIWFTDENNAIAVGSIGEMAKYHANESINYRWSPGDNILNDNTLHPDVFPEETTRYYLEAYTDDGCSTIGDVQINVEIGNAIIPNNKAIESIDIYPNPSTKHLIIDFKNTTPETYHIKVFGNMGVIKYSNEYFSNHSGLFTYYHHLSPGIYYLEIQDSKRTVFKKFIVH